MTSAAPTARPEAPASSPSPAPSGKPTYKRPNGLSVEQQNAVDLLTLGHTDLSVARTVGVSRTTVTKWRLYDPLFARTLADRRARLWQGAHDGIRAKLPGALGSISRQLAFGRNPGRFALDFLRVAGLFGKPSDPALAKAAFDEPLEMEDLLDREVRRRRDRESRNKPVTEAERDAMYDELMTLAETADC